MPIALAGGCDALFAALSGDEGHITRPALAAVWGNLVRDESADGGPAWLQLNCPEVLRTAGELEMLLEGWRELPPASSEAVAVAQLARAAVAELVVKPLAGRQTKVSKRDLRLLLEGLEVRPRLADIDIDTLFDAAGCTAMRLTVEQCCTVLCEALVVERSATTVADLVAAAKGWESRRRRAPPGTDSPPKRRASIANILWNREKEGAQSPRRRSRTFGDRDPASPSSPLSAFSGLAPASPQKQIGKAFRAIKSAGQGLADKVGGDKDKSGAEKVAADKDDQGGRCELCEELRAELTRANRKAQLREEQLRRWLELAKASVDAAMVGTAIAAEVPGSPRGGAETTLGAERPLRLRVAELEDALADAQSACEDALRRLADGRAKAEQREHELTELRAQAQSLQAELAAVRDREQWLGAARKEQEADEVRRVMELGRLREALKCNEEALAASEQREQAALIDAARLRAERAAAHSPPLASPSGLHVVSEESVPESDEEEGAQIVFLNPPGWVQRVENQHATCFEEPGQIFYAFRPQVHPSQLLFDVMVTAATAAAEYMAVRDSSKNRAFAAVIDQGALALSGTTVRIALPVGVWLPICIRFDWQRRSCAVHAGSRRECSALPFRDRGCKGVAEFDAFPNNVSGVTYANIRFVTD
eukprot:TRINITY_DN2932_c0_g2_i1.p1 TRINITY_DN2932_c0_g2~~TRINITY_DN2932_c0_g2_i1.p1  ORF type:complete len:679 (+),score=225.74 TRINITY_DN2932_c0_g2_i1:83-2038(+)